MIPPDIRIFPPDELAERAANVLTTQIGKVISQRGTCRLGLSGGGTPKQVYALMVTRGIAWERVQLFWGDERSVLPDHEASNYRMVHEALLSRVEIPERNVFRIRGEDPPEEAARSYAAVMGEEPIDILMLGMGGDGHTASLFPGEAALASPDRVTAARSPVPPHERVTITMKTINEARAVYALIGGAAKSARLAEVEAQIASGDPVLPMARVQPTTGRLVWLVDSVAAATLSRSD